MAEDSAKARYVAYELQEDLPKGTIIFIKVSGEDVAVTHVKRNDGPTLTVCEQPDCRKHLIYEPDVSGVRCSAGHLQKNIGFDKGLPDKGLQD